MDPNFHVTSATFNHTFTKFSQINKLTGSPACWIQNMPWKIFIEPVVRGNKKYLSIFVGCAAPITNVPWSCRASVTMYKLHGTKPKVIKATKYLDFNSSASTSWGHDTFILWDTVLNPANGFIRNDSIVIEIIIDAEIPVGFELTPTYFTDERATVAVKLCDQTILNLRSKVQDLTKQNKTLQSTNQTLNEEIENLKNRLDGAEKKSVDSEIKFNDEHNTNIELQTLIDESKKQLQQEKENSENITKTMNDKIKEIETLKQRIQELNTIEKDLESCKSRNDEAAKKYTTLLEEFENYKNIITSTGSESENTLKTQIDTMKNENIELKKQLSDVQNELNSAKDKLKIVNILEANVKKLDDEKAKMQKTIDSISGEISEAEKIIEKIKKEANEELEIKQKENENNKTQIQSLKSRLYESLVKLQITQDMNAEIQKLKEENNKLIEQMKVGYEKYNNLKQEKTTLTSQIDNLNKQLSGTNETINSLKTVAASKLEELEECQNQLTASKTNYSDLEKINEDMKTALDEANSKLKTLENSNSETVTSLLNEKKNLENEKASITSQLQSVQKELKEIKEQNNDNKVSLPSNNETDLINRLNAVNKELEETKAQLKQARKDVNKLILFERNLSSLQTQYDATRIELQQLEDKKLDEAVSKLNKEKKDLQNLLSSLKKELEETKATLNNKQTGSTDTKSLEDENNKLKEQIKSFKKMLDQTNTKINTLSDQKNKNNQTNQNEVPKSEVDSIKTPKNEKKINVQNQKVVKTTRSSGQEDVEDLNEFPSKDTLESRLETMKKEFEKQLKDSDIAVQVERETLMKRIDDMMYHLSQAKQKNETLEDVGKKLKGEICRLKEETNDLRNLKEEFSDQLETSKNICTHTFQIIIDILNSLKATGKLSCSVDAQVIALFNNFKQCKQLGIENITNVAKTVESTAITTDVLQEKLDELKAHHEESVNTIRKNCVLEHNENRRLRTANNELLLAIETEANVTKIYREMLKIANSRLESYRKQFNELDNKLLDEKNKRFECENMNRRSKMFGERMECLLNDMKGNLLRHAIKLSEFETTDHLKTKPDQSNYWTNFSCSQITIPSTIPQKSEILPAKMTNDSNLNRNENTVAILSSNAQGPQDSSSEDMTQKNDSRSIGVQVSSSGNSEVEEQSEIKSLDSKNHTSTSVNVT